MRLGTRRLVPLAFLLVSLLYLAFSFSLEERRMIGDEKQWDPGSRSLPMAMGFLMLGLSLYLVVKETLPAREERPVPAGARRLVVLTIAASLAYILVFRRLGFILATALLLFTLVYFNRRQDVRLNQLPGYAAGAAAGTALALLIYSAGRLLTRGLFAWGRAHGSALLAGNIFAAFLTALLMAALFGALAALARRVLRTPGARETFGAVLLAAGVTEGLYLVFKQIFLVSLPGGIVFW
jgi:hypothetical protein